MSNALGKKLDLTAETTGNLPAARITGYPPISSGNLSVVANAAARLAQTGLAVGDSTIQTDTGVLYLLTVLPESGAGNWAVWNPSIAGLTAANVVNTPAGGIVAVTVQAAIDELDTEKGTKVAIQNQSYVIAADTGAADAYAIAPSPAIAAYVAGQRFGFLAVNANTGASTLAVSGLAATSIRKNGNVVLVVGDIVAGQWVEFVYDGTNFEMVSKSNTNIPYVKLTETQAANTQGGTFTSGAWRTRTLNTEDSDVDAVCSLAANQFTLTAGTYRIQASAPAFFTNPHQAKLRNATAASDILIGTSETSGATGNGATTRSFVTGQFTVAAAQALEIQHQANTTKATDGFGAACNFGVSEIYTVVELWKVG